MSLGKLRLRQITDGCSGSASSGAIQSTVAGVLASPDRRLVRRAAYTATRMAPMACPTRCWAQPLGGTQGDVRIAPGQAGQLVAVWVQSPAAGVSAPQAQQRGRDQGRAAGVSVVVMRTVPDLRGRGLGSTHARALGRPSPPARHAPPAPRPVRSRHSRNACAQRAGAPEPHSRRCSERNTVEASIRGVHSRPPACRRAPGRGHFEVRRRHFGIAISQSSIARTHIHVADAPIHIGPINHPSRTSM